MMSYSHYHKVLPNLGSGKREIKEAVEKIIKFYGEMAQ
jgi:hypothetical protein